MGMAVFLVGSVAIQKAREGIWGLVLEQLWLLVAIALFVASLVFYVIRARYFRRRCADLFLAYEPERAISVALLSPNNNAVLLRDQGSDVRYELCFQNWAPFNVRITHVNLKRRTEVSGDAVEASSWNEPTNWDPLPPGASNNLCRTFAADAPSGLVLRSRAVARLTVAGHATVQSDRWDGDRELPVNVAVWGAVHDCRAAGR